MARRTSLPLIVAGLTAALLASISSLVSPIYNVECSCQYGNCGCRPIGQPHITPQQVTPLGPTLQPYTPPAVVTPELPNPPTPALPPLPSYYPTPLPALPVPFPPTPFPVPPTPTTLGVPSAPSLPPIGGGCPFLVQRIYLPISPQPEVYRVFLPTADNSPILVSVSVASIVYGANYITNNGWEFYLNILAPYPPEYVTVTIIQGTRIYQCTFRRLY